MKKMFYFAFYLIVLVSVTACGSTNKLKTKATWADLNNYVFAVEINEYDGDVYEKGTYKFYASAVDTNNSSKTPVVWDIYISKNLYSSLNELNDSEKKLTVGGMGNDKGSLELEKGTYVYVKYNNVVGKPTGMLEIEKK